MDDWPTTIFRMLRPTTTSDAVQTLLSDYGLRSYISPGENQIRLLKDFAESDFEVIMADKDYQDGKSYKISLRLEYSEKAYNPQWIDTNVSSYIEQCTRNLKVEDRNTLTLILANPGNVVGRKLDDIKRVGTIFRLYRKIDVDFVEGTWKTIFQGPLHEFSKYAGSDGENTITIVIYDQMEYLSKAYIGVNNFLIKQDEDILALFNGSTSGYWVTNNNDDALGNHPDAVLYETGLTAVKVDNNVPVTFNKKVMATSFNMTETQEDTVDVVEIYGGTNVPFYQKIRDELTLPPLNNFYKKAVYQRTEIETYEAAKSFANIVLNAGVTLKYGGTINTTPFDEDIIGTVIKIKDRRGRLRGSSNVIGLSESFSNSSISTEIQLDAVPERFSDIMWEKFQKLTESSYNKRDEISEFTGGIMIQSNTGTYIPIEEAINGTETYPAAIQAIAFEYGHHDQVAADRELKFFLASSIYRDSEELLTGTIMAAGSDNVTDDNGDYTPITRASLIFTHIEYDNGVSPLETAEDDVAVIQPVATYGAAIMMNERYALTELPIMYETGMFNSEEPGNDLAWHGFYWYVDFRGYIADSGSFKGYGSERSTSGGMVGKKVTTCYQLKPGTGITIKYVQKLGPDIVPATCTEDYTLPKMAIGAAVWDDAVVVEQDKLTELATYKALHETDWGLEFDLSGVDHALRCMAVLLEIKTPFTGITEAFVKFLLGQAMSVRFKSNTFGYITQTSGVSLYPFVIYQYVMNGKDPKDNPNYLPTTLYGEPIKISHHEKLGVYTQDVQNPTLMDYKLISMINVNYPSPQPVSPQWNAIGPDMRYFQTCRFNDEYISEGGEAAFLFMNNYALGQYGELIPYTHFNYTNSPPPHFGIDYIAYAVSKLKRGIDEDYKFINTITEKVRIDRTDKKTVTAKLPSALLSHTPIKILGVWPEGVIRKHGKILTDETNVYNVSFDFGALVRGETYRYDNRRNEDWKFNIMAGFALSVDAGYGVPWGILTGNRWPLTSKLIDKYPETRPSKYIYVRYTYDATVDETPVETIKDEAFTIRTPNSNYGILSRETRPLLAMTESPSTPLIFSNDIYAGYGFACHRFIPTFQFKACQATEEYPGFPFAQPRTANISYTSVIKPGLMKDTYRTVAVMMRVPPKYND